MAVLTEDFAALGASTAQLPACLLSTLDALRLVRCAVLYVLYALCCARLLSTLNTLTLGVHGPHHLSLALIHTYHGHHKAYFSLKALL